MLLERIGFSCSRSMVWPYSNLELCVAHRGHGSSVDSGQLSAQLLVSLNILRPGKYLKGVYMQIRGLLLYFAATGVSSLTLCFSKSAGLQRLGFSSSPWQEAPRGSKPYSTSPGAEPSLRKEPSIPSCFGCSLMAFHV